MWDLHRMLQPQGLADEPVVVEFRLRNGPPRRTTYWLVVADGIDLCLVDPGRDVDLCVRADLRALTEVWMGDRWIAMDPTFGEDLASVTHIKFSQGTSDPDGLRDAGMIAAELFGDLELVVKSYSADGKKTTL